MALAQSRLFPRREKCSLGSRGIRLVAIGVVMLLTLETSSVYGAQQRPLPTPANVSSQAPQSPNAQQAATPPEATAQDAQSESLDSLPSAPTPLPTPQETPQQPVGTAAAPYEKPTGVPGSRPAGAAIAPAKQRRVHAIVIRVAIVLAAGAAVGTVVGLSRATHSTPQ
jgi:cytoskeletal protein RodZ